ncbi:UDP-N-acetylmuramoyl-L-alanine--D-glutamate ligase, partial [candidate division WOR-3 bacterium]|nr:UDP-N-acetylmuramoyl-L-alanine--D-glutamate ligase [candidate division WOR-3 bacterium]
RERLAAGEVRGLARRGLRLADQPQRLSPDWAIVSPGWSDAHPVVRGLNRRGVPLADELDFASRYVRGPLVAVTGTNGKSTTTALVGTMLSGPGRRVFVGGNLAPGRPLSAALSRTFDYYVVEASSFQLERARWLAPRVAVVLNITADHLDRHGSLARYAECKLRILDRQRETDFAVLGYDDPTVRAAATRGRAQKRFFSARRRVAGAYLSRGWLCFAGRQVAPAAGMRLRGRHNLLNALAATAVGRLLGVGPGPIRRTLASFAGLPHRFQPVRRLRGVEYINNSMCTNPAAAVRSLEALGRKVVLIAGGRGKGLPVDGYARAIRRRARRAILIGEARAELSRELGRLGFRRFEAADTLRAAVRQAAAAARPGDVVLFSPGFASFDMFRDFEDRGRSFVREIRRLA